MCQAPNSDSFLIGLGFLIRMPFGVHQLTVRRHGFYDKNGLPLGATFREQLYALWTPQFVSAAFLKQHTVISSSETPETPPKRLQEPTEHVSERIKAQVTVLEFTRQYVDLKQADNGGVNPSPFHDDQHPSFGVNDMSPGGIKTPRKIQGVVYEYIVDKFLANSMFSCRNLKPNFAYAKLIVFCVCVLSSYKLVSAFQKFTAVSTASAS